MLKRLSIFLFLVIAVKGYTQTQFPPEVSPLTLNKYQSYSCPNLFIGSFRLVQPAAYEPTNYILDENGDLLWYQVGTNRMIGFMMQDDGNMTWYENGAYLVMDSNFQIIDTLRCQNGRRTDDHCLQRDGNGNYYVLCTRDTAADLSSATTNTGGSGNSNGTVRHGMVQELDPGGNLVREWDGAPFFQASDIESQYFTQPAFLDLMHPNSVDVNASGEVIVSSRHVSEVTCIDWASGQVKWRLGGPQNQFDFGNDPGLSGQHDARWTGPNRISLYDNGTYHSPSIARGIEYQLDTVNWTATAVRSFSNSNQLSSAMGNFQPQPDGSVLVNWGLGYISPWTNLSFFGPDSTLLATGRLGGGFVTYRAFCYELPFEVERPVINCQSNGGQVELSVLGNPGQVQWSDGSISSTFMPLDTGWFQAFVPLGIGWVGSEALHITDLNNPCQFASIEPTARKPREISGYFDLFGRPVSSPEKGQIYIRRWSDGSADKILLSD